jgi:hypothetical protein
VIAVLVVLVLVVLWIADDVTFFSMGSDVLQAGKKQREPIVLRSFFSRFLKIVPHVHQ